MFMTTLAIALGLVAAAGLLSATSDPQIVRALHAAAFVSAAPVAAPGVAFFVAIAAILFASGALRRGFASASLVAAVANPGALGGVLSLSGPLNSGNGAVAGVAAPVLAWVLWILLASVWLLRVHPQDVPDHPDHRQAPGA
jgi:hypothetical protein